MDTAVNLMLLMLIKDSIDHLECNVNVGSERSSVLNGWQNEQNYVQLVIVSSGFGVTVGRRLAAR